jgi:predicted RNA-binding Zn ribbon-like protein
LDAYNNHLAILAEDFINTFDLYLEQPEHLLKPADLKHFLMVRGIEVDSVTQNDLEQVRVLRERLRTIWTAGVVEDALHELNPLLAGIDVGIQVVQEGEGLHMEYAFQPDMDLVRRLGALCALGVTALLQTYGIERLRACASSPCQDVYVDTSRNKSRRFCSDRCANRYNIAAFRDRQKGE